MDDIDTISIQHCPYRQYRHEIQCQFFYDNIDICIACSDNIYNTRSVPNRILLFLSISKQDQYDIIDVIDIDITHGFDIYADDGRQAFKKAPTTF